MLKNLKKNYFLLVSTFIILYFFFNLMSGERGLVSYLEKKEILRNLSIKEANLIAKIDELDFKNSPYKFIDIETKEEIKLNPEELKEEYKKRSDLFLKELKIRCLQHKIDLVDIDINKGVEHILISYLLKRQKMF